jgi:glycosyltransferase involved in cell wall biosynthesis
MSNSIHLSVIIPAYNEEKRLPNTLKSVSEYLKKQNYSSEIIVVSDGSTDRTDDIVREMMQEIPNLRLIAEPQNHGKGWGVRKGMLEAKGEYRLFMDADNSTSIDQVEKMWPEFKEGYQVVIGSRDVKGAVLDPPQPFFRRFLGDCFKFLRKLIVGLWELEDTQCGFKAFTATASEDIFSKTQINRWAFDVEVLVIAKKLGYKIKEIPVYWINDPRSKVKFKSMVKMLFEILKVRWNLIKGMYR